MKLFGYEFTIKKVKKRKRATGFSSKKWTTSEKNTLLRFHSEGMPSEQIAKELGRTVPAVHSMISKLVGSRSKKEK